MELPLVKVRGKLEPRSAAAFAGKLRWALRAPCRLPCSYLVSLGFIAQCRLGCLHGNRLLSKKCGIAAATRAVVAPTTGYCQDLFQTWWAWGACY